MRKLAILALVPFAAMASAVVCLDDFSDGAYSVSIDSGSDLALTAATVVGGERGTYAEVEANPNSQFLDLSVGGGFDVVSSGAGLDGYTELAYGFTAGPVPDDMSLDLSAESAFRVTYEFNDLPMVMTIIAISGSGAGFDVVSTPVGGGISSTTTVDVAFAAFTGIDFSDIDQIIFAFDTPANGDFAISKLEAVPEPATMLALGLGGAALLRRRRK